MTIIQRFLEIPLQKRLMIILSIIGSFLCAYIAVSKNIILVGIIILPIIIMAIIYLIRNPKVIIWTLIISSPFNDYLGFKIGIINVRTYTTLVLIGILCFLIQTIRSRDSKIIRRAENQLKIMWPLGSLIICKLFTLYIISDWPLGMNRMFVFKYIVLSTFLYLSCFVLSIFIDKKITIEKIILIWLHISNIVTIFGFIQIILSNTLGFNYVHHREVIFFGRPYSIFREPDVLGSFAAAAIVMVLPLIIYNSKIINKKYLFFTLLIQVMMVLGIFVRAAWIAVFVCILGWLIVAIPKKVSKPLLKYINITIIIGIIMAAFLPIASPKFANKLFARFATFTKPQNESASKYRIQEFDVIVKKISPDFSKTDEIQTFFFGHGDFSWTYWAPTILGESYDRTVVELMKSEGKVLVHPGFSMFLSVIFDNGIVGGGMYTLFWILIIRAFLTTFQKSIRRENQVLLLSTFLPVICIFICFQFSYDPISPFWWVMIGIYLATLQITRGQEGI
ncbi:MAG: hypothetical protein MK193_00830 [Lentisphaeria bacterium]|nr:hypothetical protein [Lentisphaeria bacterium]